MGATAEKSCNQISARLFSLIKTSRAIFHAKNFVRLATAIARLKIAALKIIRMLAMILRLAGRGAEGE
jgi:hypothetical protein